MSKFKVGDRVVVVEKNSNYFKRAGIVEGVNPPFNIKFDSEEGVLNFTKPELMHERDWVELCCKELEKRNIENVQKQNGTFRYTETSKTGISYLELDEFLNKLYPRQSETQRKLKELEKEARKIADQMKALREGE